MQLFKNILVTLHWSKAMDSSMESSRKGCTVDTDCQNNMGLSDLKTLLDYCVPNNTNPDILLECRNTISPIMISTLIIVSIWRHVLMSGTDDPSFVVAFSSIVPCFFLNSNKIS